MARGWHGDSAGHARAGQMGGRKSAETRQRIRITEFGEKLQSPKNQLKAPTKRNRGEASR